MAIQACTPWPRAEALLLARGADRIPHPGGTLSVHLRRVSERLRGWGCSPAVQAAGLTHAAYGTDGFDPALLELAERPLLVRVIGREAEPLVTRTGETDTDQQTDPTVPR